MKSTTGITAGINNTHSVCELHAGRLNCNISLFADDTTLLRKIKSRNDGQVLGKDSRTLYETPDVHEMKFSLKEYHVFE